MKRKGFVFTLDALLSLLLVTIFITGIVVEESNSTVYSTYMRNQEKYLAEDTLKTLRTASLKDLVPPEVIDDWKSNGTLVSGLVTEEMTPLDIAATYWATSELYPGENLTHKAEIILGYLLNNTLGDYNYELLINNYTSPYLGRVGSNYSKASDVSQATLVMSGYAYNQTPRGYMARAYLTKLGSKENTYTIRGGYIYARTDTSNDEVIIKYVVPADAIPSDAVIDEIEWFLEPAWVGSYYEIYLNGHLIWSGLVQNNFKPSDYPTVEAALKQYFVPGQENVFEVRVYKSGYDGGEDGAQYIKISYTTSVPSTLKFPTRFYFEDVSANYGIESWKYLFVPGLLESMKVQVAVGNVSQSTPITLSFMFDQKITVDPTSCTYDSAALVKTCYWDNQTIAAALEANGYNYTQVSSRYTTLIVDAGYKNTRYNRIHLIREKSFVEASYVSGFILTAYTIDITEPILLPNQDWSRDVTITFNVPQGVTPLWVKFQFPWLYYTNYNPTQEIQISNDVIPPTDIYKHPPNPFIYALARVGYTSDTFDYQYNPLNHAIVPGSNTLHILLGDGYYIQPSNGDGELTYIIQAYAGYGSVFPKFIRDGCGGYNITYYWEGDTDPHYITAGDEPYCNVTAQDLLDGSGTYAIDDALVRLFNNLGGSGTEDDPLLVLLPESVKIDFASMGNIPGLFQPIRITLRVWRGS